jgi:hypothetical protein
VVTITMAPIDNMLFVERSHRSPPPATSRATGTPTAVTICCAKPKTPAGSHSFHNRKGSTISRAAHSTMASTVQLKISPK